MNPPSQAMEGRPFNFPVVLLRQQFHDSIMNKREPMFYFKDDGPSMQYVDWKARCLYERDLNLRPVSAKERAEQP